MTCKPICLGAALLAGILTMAGCLAVRPTVPVRAPGPAVPAVVDALPVPEDIRMTPEEARRYAGDAACAPCHPVESRDHARTGHAHTLRPVSPARDAANFSSKTPVSDPQNGAVFRLLLRGGRLLIEGRKGKNQAAVPMTHALGSGEAGISYLAVNAQGFCLMPRIQAYRTAGRIVWDWTPGLQPGSPQSAPLGNVLQPPAVEECFSCHSTALAVVDARVNLAQSILSVGCERCHGPAREHVHRMRAPRPAGQAPAPLGLPRLGTLNAAQVSRLCEMCHRSLSPTPPGVTPPTLARLQGPALRMSRCFLRGDPEKLSCVKCHQPHQPRPRESARYETTCKGCHNSRSPGAVLCPVNANAGCIPCHMGKETLTLFGHTVYTNHWIRTRPTPVWHEEGPAGARQ